MYDFEMQAVRDLYEIVPTRCWRPDEKRRTQIVFIGVSCYVTSEFSLIVVLCRYLWVINLSFNGENISCSQP